MAVSVAGQELIQQKLAAFERLQATFEECFQFVQQVHGLQRFSTFPVARTVYYLHALWMCDCKDRLLSIYRNINRYGGAYCLELLQGWQEQQDTASVIDFLHLKLDMLPLADITRQAHAARSLHKGGGVEQRLLRGRMILLNRGMNLMAALDTIFTLSEDELFKEVHAACEHYGHLPAQLAQQREELETPLYSYVPHQALAQRNMLAMNKLGIDVTPKSMQGQRSWRVVKPIEPLSPYAEHFIEDYQEMTSPLHNNPRATRFIDHPEVSDSETV